MAEFNTIVCEIAEKMNALDWCMSIYGGQEDDAMIIRVLTDLYGYIWTGGIVGMIRKGDVGLLRNILIGAERVLDGCDDERLCAVLRGLCGEVRFELEYW